MRPSPSFCAHELRTELAADFERIALELEELRLRFNTVERRVGIPTGLPTGARLGRQEAARLRREGATLNEIAAACHVSIGTVKADLRRERASADAAAANGHVAPPPPAEWPLTADADRRPVTSLQQN